MRILLTLITCCCFSMSYAQKVIPPPPPNDSAHLYDKIFTKVDVEASFPGGDEGWKKFLMNNLELDKMNRKVKIPKGESELRETVIVRFVVSKSGNISDVGIENEDANKLFKAEAIRVIKSSPHWIPAQQNGRTVNAYRRQPIVFLFTKD